MLKTLGGAFLCAFGLTSSLIAAEVAVNPNDVSMLFPLPTQDSYVHYLKAETQADKGAIFPRRYFDVLPQLAFHMYPENKFYTADEIYHRLAVVGIRVDPCFPKLTTDLSQCHSQIRMVLQHVEPDFFSGVIRQEVADAAIHLFFELDHEEFKAFLRELVVLREESGIRTEGILNVQPIIKQQGMNGPYAQKLKALILKHVGEKVMTRFTFMAGDYPHFEWSFGGYFVKNGALEPIKIFGTDDTREHIEFENVAPEYKSVVTPEPKLKDDFSVIYKDSGFARRMANNGDRASLEAAMKAIVRTENPTIHSPDSTDCFSCHVAESSRKWMEKNLGIKAESFDDAYRSRQPLTAAFPHSGETEVLRSFGYFESRPVFNQRVINDTAALVEYMNKYTLAH